MTERDKPDAGLLIRLKRDPNGKLQPHSVDIPVGPNLLRIHRYPATELRGSTAQRGRMVFPFPIEKLVREGKEQYRALVSGKKSLAGARKAHEMVHGTEAEKTAHWNKMQKWCNDLHSEHPDWSFEAIKRHISRNSEKVLGKEVSTKTVYRRCKNPKK